MFSERDWERLRDIVENAKSIHSYIEGMSFDAFTRDQKTKLQDG